MECVAAVVAGKHLVDKRIIPEVAHHVGRLPVDPRLPPVRTVAHVGIDQNILRIVPAVRIHHADIPVCLVHTYPGPPLVVPRLALDHFRLRPGRSPVGRADEKDVRLLSGRPAEIDPAPPRRVRLVDGNRRIGLRPERLLQHVIAIRGVRNGNGIVPFVRRPLVYRVDPAHAPDQETVRPQILVSGHRIGRLCPRFSAVGRLHKADAAGRPVVPHAVNLSVRTGLHQREALPEGNMLACARLARADRNRHGPRQAAVGRAGEHDLRGAVPVGYALPRRIHPPAIRRCGRPVDLDIILVLERRIERHHPLVLDHDNVRRPVRPPIGRLCDVHAGLAGKGGRKRAVHHVSVPQMVEPDRRVVPGLPVAVHQPQELVLPRMPAVVGHVHVRAGARIDGRGDKEIGIERAYRNRRFVLRCRGGGAFDDKILVQEKTGFVADRSLKQVGIPFIPLFPFRPRIFAIQFRPGHAGVVVPLLSMQHSRRKRKKKKKKKDGRRSRESHISPLVWLCVPLSRLCRPESVQT